MDIQMPGMDGVEALSWFRRGPSNRFAFITPSDTPVIAVTANALEGDEQRFLSVGFDDYLSKPFRQSQLHKVLVEHTQVDGLPAEFVDTGAPELAQHAVQQAENSPALPAESALPHADPTSEADPQIQSAAPSHLHADEVSDQEPTTVPMGLLDVPRPLSDAPMSAPASLTTAPSSGLTIAPLPPSAVSSPKPAPQAADPASAPQTTPAPASDANFAFDAKAVVANTTHPSDIFDAEALQRLRDLDPRGDNRLFERVSKAFETSVGRLLPQLEDAFNVNDTAAIVHVAHTLKSSSASIGALKLSQLCAEIETMIRRQTGEDLSDRIRDIPVEAERVLAGLRFLLESER